MRHESDTVILRFPELADSAEFIGRVAESAELHNNLVSPPRDQDEFAQFVSRNQMESDKCFLIVEKSTGAIAGAVNVSQIFLKGFCSAYLGYYLFEGFTGRGLMTSAIQSVVHLSFTEIGLHRIEANIQPDNETSRRVAERCGFQKEGYSRKYLRVAGEWRDHERWALIKEDWEERIN